MDDAIVTLRAYSSSIEANIVAGRLESEGIPCFVTDEFTHLSRPLPMSIGGGVKLRVLQKDLEKALQIIDEDSVEKNEADRATIACPECQSTNIHEFALVSGIFALFLNTVFGLFSPKSIQLKEFICHNCGNKFRNAQVCT